MKKIPRGEYRISITTGCNMKCVYCHNEGQSSFATLSLDDIDFLLKNSYDLGLTSVRLTGGEPLIHPQIKEMCELIKNKYGLKLGINTNLIKIDVLQELLDKNLVDRIVVGLDYFDGKISKNSPIGKSSSEIKNNILKLKKYPVKVAVDMVYNKQNRDDIEKMFEFCLVNKIEIKVLEDIFSKDEIYHNKFMDFMHYLARKHDIELITNKEEFDQYRGIKNGERVASFFNSLCYENKCDLCKNMHLRVSASGMLHWCAINDDGINFKENDTRESILKILD